MTGHDEVREALELAAVEPGGLDRLEAGDTPEAAAIAGHLAGCPACLEELARLRRADAILRPILATAPDPALRERTLALIRSAGVPRGEGSAVSSGAGADVAPLASPAPIDLEARRGRRLPAAPAWLGASAAVLVVGLLGATLLVSAPSSGDDAAAALDAITRETATLLATGDAREIVLRDGAGLPAGSLVLSATADRLVASASGLLAPTGGASYRCWVEVGGTRSVLGTMWWAEGVAWWAGDVVIPSDLPAGVVYGVSRVEAGSSGPGTVVLTGGF